MITVWCFGSFLASHGMPSGRVGMTVPALETQTSEYARLRRYFNRKSSWPRVWQVHLHPRPPRPPRPLQTSSQLSALDAQGVHLKVSLTIRYANPQTWRKPSWGKGLLLAMLKPLWSLWGKAEPLRPCALAPLRPCALAPLRPCALAGRCLCHLSDGWMKSGIAPAETRRDMPSHLELQGPGT